MEMEMKTEMTMTMTMTMTMVMRARPCLAPSTLIFFPSLPRLLFSAADGKSGGTGLESR